MAQVHPCLVQAVYSFKGKNNDELCFKKGDVITVTQKEDGGWWEGTLGGVTGWFPSNYVKDHKVQSTLIPEKVPTAKTPEELAEQQAIYRNIVWLDMVESERAHVAELRTLVSNFLEPLSKSNILSRDEYRQLVGNMDAIIDVHSKLLVALDAVRDHRVGRLFLATAPQIKQVHLAYCASHPRAVCVLNKQKEALNTFMEAQGAASPGLLVLTTGLSKPFRRLEKYTGLLLEWERHMEESHPDRGDTQRSIHIYKEIWSTCSTKRRQKEQELEVLTGGIRGWEGEELVSLGEILQMGSVALLPDHRDRYLVLFPSTLLILSVSSRMSGFIYEGKLPLSGIIVASVPYSDSCKNAFEITGPLIERIVAVCQTQEEQQSWIECIRGAIHNVKKTSALSAENTHVPVPRIMESVMGTKGSWSVTNLKPLPPMSPRSLINQANKAKTPLSPSKSVDSNFEEDIQILRVIETYCSNPSLRNTIAPVPGRLSNGPINGILNSRKTMASKEKYVMENIDLLRNQLSDLSTKVSSLSGRLDDEIRTRTILQNSVQIYFMELNNKSSE